MTWILPKQLISAFALATEESTSDYAEQSQICERLLMRRSKRSPAKTYFREWKVGNLTRLRSGLILKPSRGKDFLTEWTSSLAVTPANHSQPPGSVSAQTIPATSGHSSQMEFDFFAPASAFSRMSKDTLASDSEKSLENWNQWVTKCRGEYSVRVKLARLTNANEFLSWPTANARDWKDSVNSVPPSVGQTRGYSLGMAVAEKIWPKADTLEAVVLHGHPAPVNPSTHLSRPESWATPSTMMGSMYPETNAEKRNSPSLATQAAWATPTTRDTKGVRGKAAQQKKGNPMDTLPNQLMMIGGKLNPRWVETLMGLPVGWTMPSCLHPIVSPASAVMMSSAGNAEVTTQIVHALGQIAVTTDNRTDELRLLGNGVVPATATLAFQTLLDEILSQ